MKQKSSFHNLHNLLPTQESRIKLSESTGISITKINNWLDHNSKSVPKADELVLMADYFNCSTDYLLDLVSIQFKADDIKIFWEKLQIEIDKQYKRAGD